MADVTGGEDVHEGSLPQMVAILCTQDHVDRVRALGFSLDPGIVGSWIYEFGGPKWWKQLEWIRMRHSEEYWIEGMIFSSMVPYWREVEFSTAHFGKSEHAVIALYAGMLLYIVDRPFPLADEYESDPIALARNVSPA